MNRLLEEFGPQSTDQGGGRYHKSFTYDGAGAQTRAVKDGKEVTLYYYDEESHLLQVTDPSGHITRYTYNGAGQRVRMEEPKGVTYFIYDANDVLAEADATGTIKTAYTRGPGGRLISQWQGGETFWYHLDGLGSTIALTDESGKVRNKYGYDEFGKLLSGTVEGASNLLGVVGLGEGLGSRTTAKPRTMPMMATHCFGSRGLRSRCTAALVGVTRVSSCENRHDPIRSEVLVVAGLI